MPDYVNPFKLATQGTSAANDTYTVENTEEIDDSIMNSITNTSETDNSDAYDSATLITYSDLKEDDIELLKKELERKIQETKIELENKQNSRGVLTNIGNNIKSLFGGGDKKIINQISNYETLLNNIENDPDTIIEAYSSIMGSDLDSNNLNALRQSKSIEADLSQEEQEEIISQLETQLEELEDNFNTTKSQNGGIGKLWDGFKNLTGIGASSNKAQAEIDTLKDQIESYKKGESDLAATYKNITGNNLTTDNLNKFLNGETTLNDTKAGEKINGYNEGQKMCVDTVADIVSGIAAVGVVAFGTAVGICAAPFTGGASLGLVAAGLGMAAGSGAVIKTAIKAGDSAVGGREYSLKNAGYDVVTGAANGAMGVFSNGLAGSAGKAVMKAAGMEALETTVVKSAALTGTKALVQEATEDIAISTTKQMAVKVGAFTVGATIDGGLSGAMDAFSRDIGENLTNSEDEEDKNISEILQDTAIGTIGGAIGGVLIGGAMKGAGKVGSELGNTSFGQAAGKTIKNVSGNIGDTLSSGLNELSDKSRIVKNLADGLDNIGTDINNKFITGSLKNAVSELDDNIYSVTIGNYSVQLAKSELTDEIIDAMNKGDNTLIFNKAQTVLQEALLDEAADETINTVARNTSGDFNAVNEETVSEEKPFKERLQKAKDDLKETIDKKAEAAKTKVKARLKETKIGEYYTQAEANFHNIPVVENPDTSVMKEFGEYVNSLQDFVQSDGAFSGFASKIKDQVSAIQENSFDISSNILNLSDEISGKLEERSTLVKDLLTKIQSGEELSDETIELIQKAMDLTDIFDEKTIDAINTLQSKIEAGQELSENYKQTLFNVVDGVVRHREEISKLTSEAVNIANEIPDTNAFKQLGDMPERTKAVFDEIQADVVEFSSRQEKIQNKILEGNIEEGLQDLDQYYADLETFKTKLGTMQQNAQETGEKSGLFETFTTLVERAETRSSNSIFTSSNQTQQVQALIEEANIALPKFIQTMSSDETIPDGVRSFFKEFTSNCTTTRTIEEAQSLANELYGAGKYTIKQSYGAGSIGETYLVADETGKEYVMKMLKTNAYMEKFEADRDMFTKYIDEFVTDEADKDYKLKLVNGLFDAWEKELDYGAEAQAAKDMQLGAKRFNVAQTVELGKNADGVNVSLIMEKADGLGLDELIDLLKYKNEHPNDYLTFSNLNSEGKETNPWLKKAAKLKENLWVYDTDKYAEQLPITYQKAQNEQSMFMSASGVKTVHADPHGGNVFVSFDEATQMPKLTYIDTGNVVTRTNEEILQDITLAANMLIGNSEGIAISLLQGATLPEGCTQEEMTKKVAELLDERLYKAGVNLKDVNYTQSTMMGILKELNIIPDVSNSNLLKANLQRIKTSREIFDVTGTTANKKIDMKDMLTGLRQSYKNNPKETKEAIAPIVKWAKDNKDQALLTFFQMLFHFE